MFVALIGRMAACTIAFLITSYLVMWVREYVIEPSND